MATLKTKEEMEKRAGQVFNGRERRVRNNAAMERTRRFHIYFLIIIKKIAWKAAHSESSYLFAPADGCTPPSRPIPLHPETGQANHSHLLVDMERSLEY